MVNEKEMKIRLKKEILESGFLDEEIVKVSHLAEKSTKYLFVLQYLVMLKERLKSEVSAELKRYEIK